MNTIDKNFPIVAMLIGLGMVLTALVVLLTTGKITADSSTATQLTGAVIAIVGGIAGYSMHKTTDAAMQTPGTQVTTKETT
jgi:hypothetical protein